MKIITLRKGLVIAFSFGALILGITTYAAINNTIADGVYSNFAPFGGPASTRMRTLTIAPGEILAGIIIPVSVPTQLSNKAH